MYDAQGTEAEVRSLMEECLKVYNNLAAAQMKIKAYDAALQAVENVLRCQPNNVKAVFRKGKVFVLLVLCFCSYMILVWEFCFLPLSVHAQTNTICVTLLSLVW
jgi:hypothetical protein